MEETALRKLIGASLGLAFLAAFTLASTTNAAPILDFGQSSGANTVTSSNTGNNTTFSTTGTTVGVTALAGVAPPTPTNFTETFNFTSSQAPVGSDGNIAQGGFNGAFSYSVPGGAVQVAGNVTNGSLSTVTNGTGGTTANFNSSQVTFTTVAPAILTQAFGSVVPLNTLTGNFSLTLNNLNPATPTSLAFNARAAGIITATQAIPEPTSVVMASMALVAGLGGLGVRRFKASRA